MFSVALVLITGCVFQVCTRRTVAPVAQQKSTELVEDCRASIEHTQSHCCTCIKLIYESIFTPIASFCQSDVPPRRLFAVQKSLSVQVHLRDLTHHEQLVVYTCQPRGRQQGENKARAEETLAGQSNRRPIADDSPSLWSFADHPVQANRHY